MVLTMPPDVDPGDPEVHRHLFRMAEAHIVGQYAKAPRALFIEPIHWLITSDWREVEAFQPDHYDCETCRAGNDQAIAFLKEHPEGRLALGNLRYTEVW
jgi:hypothetical protein